MPAGLPLGGQHDAEAVVIQAQIGARFGTRLRAEQTRLLLALLVLAVCLLLLVSLVETPADPFVII